MILAIDIGNTYTVLGGIDDEGICFVERISSDDAKTGIEYAIKIRSIFEINNIDLSKIDGCLVSSVVPQLTIALKDAVKKIFKDIDIMNVGPGIKTGINILIDNPAQLGSDQLAAAVAATREYEAPLVLIDFGTATTISVIKEKSRFVGGMILPGVNTSLKSLVSNASLLQHISLDKPQSVVGKNTIDCMKSGIIYGTASAVDGVIEHIKGEVGAVNSVIATGEMSEIIVQHCRHKIVIDDDLVLKGLKIIYDKNNR